MELAGGCAILIAIVIAVIAATAALIAYGKRDAQRHHRGSGGLGVAMQELEGLFIESKKHVIQAERDAHEDEDESGDPPEK